MRHSEVDCLAVEFPRPPLGETSMFGGPEAAGKAPRTAERQMPPAAEAQNQELAPKQAQPRQILALKSCYVANLAIYQSLPS
jgi:hypothetical protein